jgi:HD-like signal output (HDOD) protein
MCSAPPPPITRALPDLQAWTAHFLAAPVPVLADTAELLEAYRANEDAVDAHLLAETVSADPLMSLKLMAHVAGARSQRSTTDPETVTAALVMLGISPFFRAFGPQTTVDEYLGGNAAALQGLGEVLRRANRGAAFALAFAVHRMDHDAQVIHAAAQLHPALRSAAIQRELLHVELHDLQQALMRAWHLPELLVRINDERHADPAQVRNVQLAVRLARHTARGWDNAALPDDVRDIAALLNLGETPTLHLLRDIDA